MFSNESTYYRLRFVSWVVIPLGALVWYVISGVLHLATPSIIVGVVIVLDAYLGLTLQISTAKFRRQYRKQAGVMNIEEQEGKVTFTLELDMDPDEIRDHDELFFKVSQAKG